MKFRYAFAALSLGLLSPATLLVPTVASAQAVPSYAFSQAGVDRIQGRITSFDGQYDLLVQDERGYIDRVRIHTGTIINPTGITLRPGMVVSIIGENVGDYFSGDEIDTPYSITSGVPYYQNHPWNYYGSGFALGFFFGSAGWWHGNYFSGYNYGWNGGYRRYAIPNYYPGIWASPGSWSGHRYGPWGRAGYGGNGYGGPGLGGPGYGGPGYARPIYRNAPAPVYRSNVNIYNTNTNTSVNTNTIRGFGGPRGNGFPAAGTAITPGRSYGRGGYSGATIYNGPGAWNNGPRANPNVGGGWSGGGPRGNVNGGGWSGGGPRGNMNGGGWSGGGPRGNMNGGGWNGGGPRGNVNGGGWSGGGPRGNGNGGSWSGGSPRGNGGGGFGGPR